MTTELERLKVWMEANGYDERSLRKAMGTTNSLRNILNGTRRIHEAFRWHFGRDFGNAALLEVFGIDKGNDRECFIPGKQVRLWQPERYAAWRAVQNAITDGLLLPAKAYKCRACDKQAQQYHHPSYHPDDHLCVVPLCTTCHLRHHKSGLELPPLGIIARPIGIIRIAIAGLDPASELEPA